MARVCAFVFNPVVRDARVIKQANSLVAQGHEVTIIGLADNNYPEERARLESGIEILRVPREVGRITKPATKPAAKPVRKPTKKSPRLLGRLSRIPNKAVEKHLHLLLVPFLLGYIGVYGLTGSFEDRIIRLFELLIYGLLAAGFVYLLANLAKMVDAIVFLVGQPLLRLRDKFRHWLSRLKDKFRQRLTGILRPIFPRRFEQEIDRRSRLRIAYMVEMARELKPDIVHCHDAHTLPAGKAMKKLTGCRVIYDAHEIYEEIAQSNPEAAKRYREIHKTNLPSIDGFITINDSIAGWYKENYHIVPEPTVVMNATIRTPSFKYDGRLHKAARLPARQKILLYQGGFASKRGLQYLVEAAAFLPAGWTLVMMGWGSLESVLRDLGDKVNASTDWTRKTPAVCFIPAVPQDELPYWSAGATIGVIPYENVGLNHWFCTPNKLWEYPNAGVPVLVSPFPELRKPVEAYGYGWLLPEEQDPLKLAWLIASLDKKEIERARAACAVFSEEENWSKYEARLLALYDRIDPNPAKATEQSDAGNVTVEANTPMKLALSS
jgi:glycosyltransferase involved in cell wall biosynthesis